MAATANSMNFLIQKNDASLSLKIPRIMREMIHKEADRQNMSDSNYVKLAIQQKLERDLAEE
ncbi:hypothetical protein [Draconibacterium sp.]|uniref:hypothetical protein n=1 Tax=Draconibacterium sp. TaxID=1965318 RepID=UPI003562061F